MFSTAARFSRGILGGPALLSLIRGLSIVSAYFDASSMGSSFFNISLVSAIDPSFPARSLLFALSFIILKMHKI